MSSLRENSFNLNREFVERLRCPKSGSRLRLVEKESSSKNEVSDQLLVSEDGMHSYPIQKGIPRFVPESNYADNFGMQWNHFAKTQLDSHSGHPISSERFWNATGWDAAEMKNKWVLDAGCGSGRFAEVALCSGAHVVALDYSTAVDACWANLKHHSRLFVVQGDIYALPFAPESFDYVYSLGVLQHTPEVARAFAALPPMVVGGGQLCVDYYEKTIKSCLLPKYWLRPFTKHLPKHQLFTLLHQLVPFLLSMSRTIGCVPLVGRFLRRLIPVANYEGILPLSEKQLTEWALLDTFDWLSPTYDNPQTLWAATAYLENAKLDEIEVLRAGHLVARGRKP